MNSVIEEVLVSRDQLNEMVSKTARRISDDYRNGELVLIGVLKGGFVFMADLMRAITIPVELDFISVSSYGQSTKSSGVVKIMKDIDTDITGKDVLIIEDLVDTGLTLAYLKQLLLSRKPKSVKICAALNKPSRRKVELDVDYDGIEIPDKFVVGYGLDYAGKYRNFPDVCVLKPMMYTE